MKALLIIFVLLGNLCLLAPKNKLTMPSKKHSFATIASGVETAVISKTSGSASQPAEGVSTISTSSIEPRTQQRHQTEGAASTNDLTKEQQHSAPLKSRVTVAALKTSIIDDIKRHPYVYAHFVPFCGCSLYHGLRFSLMPCLSHISQRCSLF